MTSQKLKPWYLLYKGLVGLAGGLVRSAHVQNAIGIDVVGHLDLGHATGSWRNAVQVELAQQVVVLAAVSPKTRASFRSPYSKDHGVLALFWNPPAMETPILWCITVDLLGVLGHGTLALEDLDQDSRLVVRIGGESLRFPETPQETHLWNQHICGLSYYSSN